MALMIAAAPLMALIPVIAAGLAGSDNSAPASQTAAKPQTVAQVSARARILRPVRIEAAKRPEQARLITRNQRDYQIRTDRRGTVWLEFD